jgi:hypothetical protein
MKNLENLEKKRLEAIEKLSQERKRALFILIPGIILTAVGVSTEIGPIVIIGIIAIVVGIIFLSIAYSHITAFSKSVKEKLIQALLQEAYEDVRYNEHAGIPLNQILKTDVVKRPDRYTMEDYFTATYHGVTFETSDLDFKERVQHRDSKGHTYYTYETYFKGRWITYKFEKEFSEGLKIIESRFGFNKRGYEKFDTESIEFNKKFTIYATSKEYGFYQITSSMIEKLLKLEKMHKGQIVYCFIGNELHIGINDRKDYLEVSYKQPITEEGLKPVIDDIELIAAIINEFRLDSQKFKN